MEEKRIDVLIEKAHAIFSHTSIYEVIDLENRQAAEEFLKKTYNCPEDEKINEYLDILEVVKAI